MGPPDTNNGSDPVAPQSKGISAGGLFGALLAPVFGDALVFGNQNLWATAGSPRPKV